MRFHEALGSRQVRWWLFGIVVILALDRWAKWIAVTQWSLRPIRVLPGVSLEFLLNPGIALSIPLPLGVFLLLAALFAVGLFLWLRRQTPTRTIWIAVIAVMLSALNNVIDRFQYHGVVDYLHVVVPTVINLSDLVIIAGLVMLAVRMRRRG